MDGLRRRGFPAGVGAAAAALAGCTDDSGAPTDAPAEDGTSTDEPGAFPPCRPSPPATNERQFHGLGIADALAGTGLEGPSTTERGRVDCEVTPAVAPDPGEPFSRAEPSAVVDGGA